MKRFSVTFLRLAPEASQYEGKPPVTIEPLERPVRFTSTDGIALRKKFGKPVGQLLQRDVLGLDDAGASNGAMDQEVQLELLCMGLANGGMKVPLAQIHKLWNEHILAGGGISELVIPCLKAAFYSGMVTGKSEDVDARVEEVEEALGKTPAPEEAAS